jgi:hypothetical protein
MSASQEINEDKTAGTCNKQRRENLKGRDDVGGIDADGKIMSKWII